MIGDFLKSSETNQKAYVRFFNITKRSVEIIWLNFEGVGIPYKILKHREFCDIDTYFKHYWIINDTETKERMNVFFGQSRNPKTMFTPIKYESLQAETRKWVFITLPVFSLKELCYQKLRSLKFNRDKLKDHHMPSSLIEEFKVFSENPNSLRTIVQ